MLRHRRKTISFIHKRMHRTHNTYFKVHTEIEFALF